MESNDTGIGWVKADNDKKRGDLPKKKRPAIRSNWGSEKHKAEETAERSSKHQPTYQMREIESADVKSERVAGR